MSDNPGTANVPAHVAIIMDGNGRWAKKRFISHTTGHKAGAQALKKLAPKVEELGVKYLTVYAFSTENWQRPEEEVKGLMLLLHEYIQQYIDDAKKNNMRLSVIGDKNRLEHSLQEKIAILEDITAEKPGLHVNIALNYGGRDEITRAAKQMASLVQSGEMDIEAINEKAFAKYLDTSKIPDPDLLIKTGGEMRLSNFMLWQLAYAEIYVLDKLWPDFTIRDFNRAIIWFGGRERRFGKR